MDVGEGPREALERRNKEPDPGPDRFLTISFANTRFDGEAIFSGRSFEYVADFTNAQFFYPPNFDGVTNVGRINFTGARIGFVPLFVSPSHLLHQTKVPLRLRALRKIAEDTKNHDLERDLYVEERKAELGVYFPQLRGLSNATRRIEHGFRIIVMALYWALANYGQSSVLPLAWLFGSGFTFYRGYLWILAPMMSKVNPLDMDKCKHAVGLLALGNAVPFVGPLTIDAEIKKFLFSAGDVSGKCVPLPPEGFQLLVIGQNLFSIILIFFIGLALRNYFKIK